MLCVSFRLFYDLVMHLYVNKIVVYLFSLVMCLLPLTCTLPIESACHWIRLHNLRVTALSRAGTKCITKTDMIFFSTSYTYHLRNWNTVNMSLKMAVSHILGSSNTFASSSVQNALGPLWWFEYVCILRTFPVVLISSLAPAQFCFWFPTGPYLACCRLKSQMLPAFSKSSL